MLIELLLGTGIRIGSAIGLDVEDLDLDHGEMQGDLRVPVLEQLLVS